MKRSVLALGIAAALGIVKPASSAELISFDVSGWMTFLSATGDNIGNPDSSGAPMYGKRTPINGVIDFNREQGTGIGVIAPFSFLGSGYAVTQSFSLDAIGDGDGGAGPLLLGNLTMDWNGTYSIPLSAVFDATGLLSSIGEGLHYDYGSHITTGAVPATDDYEFDFGKISYTLPIGPGPLVTTTWNTTAIGTPELGSDPSGTLPLVDDGIGGSPALTGPFPGFNFNFDFVDFATTGIIIIEECPPICGDPVVVPLPATIWLLGSGLLGLLAFSRKAAAR